MIESCVAYVAGVLNDCLRRKLCEMEVGSCRKCCRLTLKDRVRNGEMEGRTEAEETVMDTIEKQRLLWYGHVRRMPVERLPKRGFVWKPPKRRRMGRQKYNGTT
jgi:hypothetical protein